MKKIKFKGIYPHSGQWFYGDLIHGVDGELRIVTDRSITPVKKETVSRLLFTTASDLYLYDGDIFDIGQTVNGCSEFVIIDGYYGIEIYYNYDRTRPYEYEIRGLLEDEFNEIKMIGNIKQV